MKRSITSTTLDSDPIPSKQIKMEPEHEESVPIPSKQIKVELEYEDSVPPSENDYEEIWSQLKVMASNIIASGCQTEVNDIIFVISQDPDKLTFLDIDYGSDNVNCIIKKATKLLYPDGACDGKLLEYLWLKRNELIKTFQLSYLTTVKAISSDWKAVINVTGDLFRDFIFHVPKPMYNELELKAKRIEFTIVLSTQPSIIRNHIASLEIGTAKVEMAVAVCEHILDGVRKQHPENSSEYLKYRNRKIRIFWDRHLKNIIASSERTFHGVRSIVTKYWSHETDEFQLDALTILLIMDMKMLRSKYLLCNEAIHISEEQFADIESELKMWIQPRDTKMKMQTECINIHMDSAKEISMPIVAYLKHEGRIKRFSKKLKTFLHLKLLGRTDLSFIGHYKDGYLICGNRPTMEWLIVTISEFPHITTIHSWTQLTGNDFREIIMLSPTRLTKSFDLYMHSIKASHPALRTGLWIWLTSTSQWEWHIKADVQSILYLERHNRRLEVEELILKFDIRYTSKV